MKRFIPFVFSAFILVILSCSNVPTNIAGNGSQIGNPAVVGILVNLNGTPAIGVTVQMFNANFTPFLLKTSGLFKLHGTASDSALTDAQGKYALPLPDSGIYNIIGAAKDGKTVFIDSVIISGTATVEVPQDTIKAPGSIRGISFMPGLDSINQIRVTMYIPGTNFITKPNIGGIFSFAKVPEGTYRMIFDPTNTDYNVTIITVKVISGQVTDLDTIFLYGNGFTGLPTANAGNDTTVSVNDTVLLHGKANDSYGRVVKLEWDIGNTGHFAVASADTALIMPATANYSGLLCILRATDNDSNVVKDTIRIVIDSLFPYLHPDTLWVPVTYYDFHWNYRADWSMAVTIFRGNPDFETGEAISTLVQGMVQDTLDNEFKPLNGAVIFYSAGLQYWFRPCDGPKGQFRMPLYRADGTLSSNTWQTTTYDTVYKNVVIRDSLPFLLSDSTLGSYVFDSDSNEPYATKGGFFPIDNRGFGTEGDTDISIAPWGRNYAFTMEIQHQFRYMSGQKYEFSGDDDLWVFVNKRLVLDLGGIHARENGGFDLDAEAARLGLQLNQIYTISIFYAERRLSGSNCKISTNMLLK